MSLSKERPFQVILVNPEQMFAEIQDCIGNVETEMVEHKDEVVEFDEIVSEALLDEHFFSHEYTQLAMIFGQNYLPFYCMRSTLYISDQQLSRPPHGFYSLERVNRFREELEKQGLPSSIDGSPESTDTEVVISGENGLSVLVEFGPKSRQDVGHQQRAMIEGAPMIIRKLLIPRAVRMANQPLSNDWINLHLTSHQNIGLSPWCCKLEDQKSFTGNLRFYAQVYEKTLIALYHEREVQPPNTTILLSSN